MICHSGLVTGVLSAQGTQPHSRQKAAAKIAAGHMFYLNQGNSSFLKNYHSGSPVRGSALPPATRESGKVDIELHAHLPVVPAAKAVPRDTSLADLQCLKPL